MDFEYFYGDQSEAFAFYRTPKLFYTDEKFRTLSSDAKILYGIMLDRLSLSVKNDWRDDDGRVYIYMTLDSVEEMMGCARQKAVALVKELNDFVKITVNAFKPVSTFDISQTDGEPLPQIGVAELVGNVEGYGTLLEAIKDASPVPISFENIESGAKGFYHQTEKRIAIQDGMSEAQTVKTALHEIAHAKYHAIEVTEKGDQKSKAQKECEAESIAYVCCQHYGLNTSDYSFGYVAGWSSGKETPELKASLQTIKEGASEIIDAIDQRIRELTRDRVEQNRAAAALPFDQAEFERITADGPFDSPESNLPVGFIKIEPPVSAEDIKAATTPIKLSMEKNIMPENAEDEKKVSTPKSEKKEKKSSVTKKLADKKKEAAKAPKKEKANDKNMQEAI